MTNDCDAGVMNCAGTGRRQFDILMAEAVLIKASRTGCGMTRRTFEIRECAAFSFIFSRLFFVILPCFISFVFLLSFSRHPFIFPLFFAVIHLAFSFLSCISYCLPFVFLSFHLFSIHYLFRLFSFLLSFFLYLFLSFFLLSVLSATVRKSRLHKIEKAAVNGIIGYIFSILPVEQNC